MIKPAYQCPIDRPTLEATRFLRRPVPVQPHPFHAVRSPKRDLAGPGTPQGGESIMVQRARKHREIDEAPLGRFELTKAQRP